MRFRAFLPLPTAMLLACLVWPAHAIELISGLGGPQGFGEEVLPATDDASTGAIDLTAIFGAPGLSFFGTRTTLFVNNNGNITFDTAFGVFNPAAISSSVVPLIAPYFADVDTRGAAPGGSNLVYYDLDATGRTITITWDLVGYHFRHIDKVNSFQVRLVGTAVPGDFDIEFRYNQLQWTTGDASGGVGGLGGDPARAGYSAGNTVDFFEVAESGNQDAMLDLVNRSNVGVPGLFIFLVRGGVVITPQPGTPTTTPTATVTPTDTAPPSATATHSPTLTPSPSVTPTNTVPPTATPTVTPTTSVTPTGTVPPTATPSVTPTASLTPTDTITPTPSVTPTETSPPTSTPTLAPTATGSLPPTATPTSSPTPTLTPTETSTPSVTSTGTLPPTSTPTLTPTATGSLPPTATPTPPTTPEATNTATPTASATATETPAETATQTPTATPTPSPVLCSCVGDCNCNGEVTIDEILTMVNIALGGTDVALCLSGDASMDGQITVDEIITAVNNALNGCPPAA